jgi:CHAT domain-containing protein
MVDAATRAWELQRSGVAATASGRPALAVRTLRRGLRLLGWEYGSASAWMAVEPSLRPVAARLLISLAHAEAEQGDTRLGFALLDAAEPLVAADDVGILVSQRGLLCQRTGDAHALDHYDKAIPLLEASPHAVVLARTLLNRAPLVAAAGGLAAATEDLSRCLAIAREQGARSLEAKALHNLGMADVLGGAVARGLGWLAEAEAIYRTDATGFVPLTLSSRAQALLAAGLASAAAHALDEAIAALAGQRLTHDEAEALLLRARAALGMNDAVAAADFAERAATGFRRRRNTTWTALARLQHLRADFAAGADPTFVRRARQLASRLSALGLTDDAHFADLLAARALIGAGRPNAARALLRAPTARRTFGWLETRLLHRLASAEFALAHGQPVAAMAHARAGLAALDDHRGRLGSLDLRVGSAALGRELAALGLRTALAGGNPRTVLQWSERSRAQAFRVQPVRPPDDPDIADALAQLRALRHQLRTAELAGAPRDTAAQARCAELERLLREREWQTAGAGVRSAPLAELPAVLGDRALVSYLNQDGELCAVLVTRTGTRLARLGPTGALTESVRRLLADLDALAGRTLPERLAGVVEASLRRQCQELSARLVEPLVARVGDRELVIVPTDELAALPWAMLPALRGRPVSVAPSAAVWLAAQARPSTVEGGVLLAAGPDLAHVDREFDEIALVHPGSRQLRDGHARVADTLAGLDGAALAHLAGHGHHEPENVLFSRLDLADGPLLAYDVQRLAAVPRLITLSACDIGRAEYRTGQEQLGFTSALLYAGAAGVVASVCRVSHESAANVMTALHRGLAGGAGAAAALAAASEKEPLATFVAFGAG